MTIEHIAPNHTIIYTDKGKYLQSYHSIVVFISKSGQVTLGRNWNYSNTTGKYRNIFLGEDKKTTQRNLDKGIYILNYNLKIE